MQRGPGGSWACSGLRYRGGSLRLGNPSILWWSLGPDFFCRRKPYSIILDTQHSCTLFHRETLSLRLFAIQTSLQRESRRKAAGASAYGTPTNVRDPGRVVSWHTCENYLSTQSCFSHAVASCSPISSLCIFSPGTSLPTMAEHMASQNDVCISHLLMQPGVAEWLSFEQQALSVACNFWKAPFNGGNVLCPSLYTFLFHGVS